jgi:hypothetical protein
MAAITEFSIWILQINIRSMWLAPFCYSSTGLAVLLKGGNDIVFEAFPIRIILGIDNNLRNDLVAILIGTLARAFILGILVGLDDDLVLAIFQLRTAIGSKVMGLAVSASLRRPKTLSSTSVYSLLDDLCKRHFVKESLKDGLGDGHGCFAN